MPDSNIPLKLSLDSSGKPTAVMEYPSGGTILLPGIGFRFTADFSNATAANRTFFQSATANGATQVGAIPNGTSTAAGFIAYTSSAPDVTTSGGRMLAGAASYSIEAFGSTNPMTFLTNGSERLRIAAGGAITIGTTSQNPIGDGTSGVFINQVGQLQSFVNSGSAMNLGVKGISGALMSFYYNPSGSLASVGSISTNGTTTFYNTSSDYRLKDEVYPLDQEAATERIMAYEPCTWTWRTDGSHGKGFIAHKNQAIDPDTATGKKDEVQRIGNIRSADYSLIIEGVPEPADMAAYPGGAVWVFTEERPVYQGRDDTKLIPDMVAMMQRQEARILDLEEKLRALLAA